MSAIRNPLTIVAETTREFDSREILNREASNEVVLPSWEEQVLEKESAGLGLTQNADQADHDFFELGG